MARVAFAENIPIVALRVASRFPGGRRMPVGVLVCGLFERLLRRLQKTERQLQPEVERAEKEFLSLGVQLGRLSAVCTEVVHHGERLFALATGQEQAEEAVAGTSQFLDPSLSFLERLSDDAALAAEAASGAAKAVQQILDSEEALMRVMSPLAYMRTLFHIESARLPGEVRQMFGALIADIENLQSRVHEQFAVKCRELRQMLSVLKKLEQHCLNQQQAIAAEGQQARERLSHLFEELQNGILANAGRDTGLARLVDRLSSCVDRMVVAMQTHDMFSQRIAHVRHAVDALHTHFAVLRSGDLEHAYRTLPTLAATASLQAAQVSDANAQLFQAAQSLRSTVDEVLANIQEVDEDCLILRSFQHITAAANGTMQVLLDSMEDTAALITRARVVAESYHSPLQPLGTLASSLADDIDEAGQRMLRIALNTQLIAVQQGEGTGLEALAGIMAESAAEISRICEHAARGLADLTKHLHDAIVRFGAVAESGRQLERMFQESGEAHRRSLHAQRDTVFEAFENLRQSSEDARRVARRMREVDLAPLCAKTLPMIAGSLREIATRLDGVCIGLRADEVKGEELAMLRAQYTMHSERMVYQESLGNANAADLSHSAGGDIELF